ncbi:hypothetical protein D910_09946 [Dendroctonus ponderosae]|uniref:Uncharacterized protein n=1 Tax=Dendroctonus ponderosae TaxID=77166 RepID=U4UJI3_DENPD|nr:hypothetical protein D910_09946 [Dendroctonus ponderosae]
MAPKYLIARRDQRLLSLLAEGHVPGSSNKSTSASNTNQGYATLIVMLAVLTIIVLFCCFSAPGIRNLCKRYIFRSCPYDDPEVDNGSTPIPESSTPTVILLPYGRMLVVDRSIFSQLQADQSGIDLLELSANLIRNQSDTVRLTCSTPSILDSDTTSKGLSPTSLGFGPPAYEDIFGLRELDLPPSYSEVSLLLLNNLRNGECIELEEVQVQPQKTTENGANGDCTRESGTSL